VAGARWLHLVLGPGTRGACRCVWIDVGTKEEGIGGPDDLCKEGRDDTRTRSYFETEPRSESADGIGVRLECVQENERVFCWLVDPLVVIFGQM